MLDSVFLLTIKFLQIRGWNSENMNLYLHGVIDDYIAKVKEILSTNRKIYSQFKEYLTLTDSSGLSFRNYWQLRA